MSVFFILHMFTKKKKITLTDPRHAVRMYAVPCQILKLVTNLHDIFLPKLCYCRQPVQRHTLYNSLQ